MVMRRRPLAIVLLGLMTACGSAAVAPRPLPIPARSTARVELTAAEWRVIESGAPVHHERQLTRGDQRYLGTVSYQLVRASPATVLAAFADLGALPELLPQTQRASLVDSGPGWRRVELVQGNDWVRATYTVWLEPDPDGFRFRLDRTRPRDIDDAWGYFRVEHFDRERSLVTVGAAVDVGSGIVRFLFSDAIENAILTTPNLIRQYAERREAERATLASGKGLGGPLASRESAAAATRAR